MLRIPANDRIEVNCKAAIVEKSADVSYKKAAESITECGLSRQSVCNAVREAGVIPAEAASIPKVNRQAPRIYIEANENHVAMQNGKTKQNKLILIYEDKKTVCKGRRELVAKRVFTGYRPAAEIWKTVNAYIKEAYEPETNVTIIGDGAAWIKRGQNVIPHSEFALELFHLSKYTKKTGNKSGAWIYEMLRANEREQFKARVEEERKKHPERAAGINEGAKYIENQWEGARRSLNDDKISSSTEVHVSHILSDRLSSRGMGWSEENSEIIGSFRAYRENGGNLGEYIIRRFRKGEGEEAAAGVQTVIQERLGQRQESVMRRIRQSRLGIRIGHMPGSEWGKNAWMRGIINGNMN